MDQKPNVLIGGGTGLVGKRLAIILREKGFGVHILTRSPKGRKDHFTWDIRSKTIDPKAFDGVQYMINLAGTAIADGLWTKSRKNHIVNSRLDSNNLLIEKFKQHDVPIKAFISASAVGIYGDKGDTWITENDRGNPNEFLVDTCIRWENTLNHKNLDKVRKVKIRIGLVLAKEGGVLPKLLLSFKAGFGSYFGNGEQYYPWIHIDDLCYMFVKAIEDDSLEGAYNGVAPNPLTNKDMIRGIGEILNKKTIIGVPKIALKIGMGEMSKVVLNSNRVSAEKILSTGFKFGYPRLKEALQNLVE